MKPELPIPPPPEFRSTAPHALAVVVLFTLTITIGWFVFIAAITTPTPKEPSTMSKPKTTKKKSTPASKPAPPHPTAGAAAFKRVATPRVERVLEAMRILGNTADDTRYDYTPAQAEKMFAVLTIALCDLQDKFRPGAKPPGFNFDDEAEAPPADPPPMPVLDDEPDAGPPADGG